MLYFQHTTVTSLGVLFLSIPTEGHFISLPKQIKRGFAENSIFVTPTKAKKKCRQSTEVRARIFPAWVASALSGVPQAV